MLRCSKGDYRVSDMNEIRIRQVLALLVAVLQGPAVAAPDGEALYIEHCAACHHMEGEGGIGLPLIREKLQDMSDRYLFKTIRLGRPGRVMPAYQRMSDAQVDAVIAFMRKRSGTTGREYDPSPIVADVERGAAVYDEYCLKCHEADGSGEGEGTGVTLSRDRTFLVMPASISNSGFLESVSDQMMRHVIAVGRKSSDMPGFADRKLTDQQIDDVVAYVRSFADQVSAPEALDEDERPTHVFESPYPFEQTVANVKAALTGANFRIFPDRLVEQGLTDEFSVNNRQIGIRFCNFNVLYGMLKIEPRLGVVLPCRITVLEREGGEVLLVVPNLRVVSRWFNNDELVTLWDHMEETFNEIVDEVTL
jgi:cytochrome c oxidase cbb3-type subunit 3